MADFGFVGASYEAPSIYQDAQECINWYPEIDPAKPDGSRGVVALYPTPGLIALVTSLNNAPVRAMHTSPDGNSFIAVVGNTVYLIDSNYASTTLGTLTTNIGYVQIQDNNLQAMIVDGVNRYSYTYGQLSSFTVIAASDGGFQGANTVDIVDNYLVYSKGGNSQEWGSTNALSTASPQLSFASKFGSSDNLVGLIVNNRQVYLMGQQTSEIWTDAGLFPFPFQIIPGTSSQFGCAAVGSIARLGPTSAFLSKNSRGQAMFMMFNGYTPVRISTHAVENTLQNQYVADAIAYTYQLEGHEFYVCSFPSLNLTWVYDAVTQLWHKWLSIDVYGNFQRHRSNCTTVFQNKVLVGDYQNGYIYALDNNVYTDNGTTIRRVRRAPHLVTDLQRQYFDEMQIQFQPGVGLSTGQGQNPQAMLRWSSDGGSTWSKEYWTSVGLQGKYNNRAIWRRLGWSRDRIFEVSTSDPVKFVIVSANLKASEGEN
jgi:Phage stabilisation protein